jgi:hypothetical protein
MSDDVEGLGDCGISSLGDSNVRYSLRDLSPVTPSLKYGRHRKDSSVLSSPETSKRALHNGGDGCTSVDVQSTGVRRMLNDGGVNRTSRDLSGNVTLPRDENIDVNVTRADGPDSNLSCFHSRTGISYQLDKLTSGCGTGSQQDLAQVFVPRRSSRNKQIVMDHGDDISCAEGGVTAYFDSVAAYNEMEPALAADESDCEILSIAVGTGNGNGNAGKNKSMIRPMSELVRRRRQKYSDVEPSDSDEHEVNSSARDSEDATTSAGCVHLFDDPVCDVDGGLLKEHSGVKEAVENVHPHQAVGDDRKRGTARMQLENTGMYENETENSGVDLEQQKDADREWCSVFDLADSEDDERSNSADEYVTGNLMSPRESPTKIYKHERNDERQRENSNSKRQKMTRTAVESRRKHRGDSAGKMTEENARDSKMEQHDYSKRGKRRKSAGAFELEKAAGSRTSSRSKSKQDGGSPGEEVAFEEDKCTDCM